MNGCDSLSLLLETDEIDEATTFNGTIPQVLTLFNGDLVRKATMATEGTFLQKVSNNSNIQTREKAQSAVSRGGWPGMRRPKSGGGQTKHFQKVPTSQLLCKMSGGCCSTRMNLFSIINKNFVNQKKRFS